MIIKKPDKKTKLAITKETLAIWQMWYIAGYESCIEDANDLETHTEEKKPEDVELAKNITELMLYFKSFNKSIIIGHKGQRNALNELLKTYTVEQIKNMIDTSFRINGQPFAPIITNAYELFYKLTKLESYLERNDVK